ncbi:alpha-mannosidase [Leptothermofonsia sp. ETS-13]|uniref:alpha-mannosidase n=1 Tax=Leptothermofonsia sp. ETS-13 TaxID=3035696 RepID=UPI003BA3B2D0
MSKSVSVFQEDISQAIERLRNLTQISIQLNWHYWEGDLPFAEAIQPGSWKNWAIADLNHKNHIAWSKGRNVRWLGQIITVPKDLQGYPLEGLCLRLALTWWAESAHIFVNGQGVQEGDLFDCSTRVLLSPDVTPGEEIAIALRLVSPGHDDGALVKSLCVYEVPSPAHSPEPGFIADELAVLYQYLETFAPEKLEFLADAIAQIDWSTLHTPHPNPSFNQSLAKLRDRLLPLSNFLKQRKIYLLGHAHLDMAWLWTVDETWKAAERTFESVLNLQKDFPELIFCHSTPALYKWIEQNRPDLFHQIQQQIEAGKWEPIGGLWVEPELNIISGEAIVRHILYGQRYFQKKFGSINRIAWLPDSFGFNWQLPQFLKQGGIEYFVTQKLRWNDTTQFPYDLFQWQAPDGTQILSLMSAPIGEGIDPVKMATYACDWEAKTGIPSALWLPGVGDHGGGPTRDMLEVAQRWQKSPFFPQLEFSTALDYLQNLEATYQPDLASGLSTEVQNTVNEVQTINDEPQSIEGEPQTFKREPQVIKHESLSVNDEPQTFKRELQSIASEPQNFLNEAENLNVLTSPPPSSPLPHLPLWNSDLYLEFHRGCYTTHGDQKWWNRRCEQWLYWAELYASLATIAAGTPYPKADLETAWKQVLFNQFHDILPGSAVREVYEDADRAWRDATNQAIGITNEALKAIATQISLPPPPHPNARAVVVFNPCNWERSAIVNADISQELTNVETLTEFEEYEQNIFYDWQLCDLEGREVEAPFCIFTKSADSYDWGLTFLAKNVPALGYRCFWTYPRPDCRHGKPIETKYVLENRFLRVEIDPTTGDLSSIFDKLNQREVLNGAGNQLQAFRDAGQYWDAWNIDPNYEKHPLPPAELLRITSNGGTRMHNSLSRNIMVERKIGQSVFSQTYILEQESPLLKIQTSVDWKERHILVKAAFPLNLETDYVTYEIPCGVIQRTTRPGSDREKAQWEVPAIRWANLSDGNYGVSLLSDCKHGYDAQPNQLRLTLLRGSEFPNPQADQGHHSFTYAIYPHTGNWKTAQTIKHGQELDMPLLAVIIPVNGKPSTQTLPSAGSFLDLGAENLMLMSFKQAEDSPHEWILRCYECCGDTAELNLQGDLNLKLKQAVDLLEQPTNIYEVRGQTVTIPPWKIASFKISTN